MTIGPVLLYDDTCGFCADSIQLILKHDRKQQLRFASLDSNFGRGVLQRHPELMGVDSVVWLERDGDDANADRVLTRSAAALQVAAYLGGFWRLAMIARLVPRPLRDVAYRFVARHRHHLTRAGRRCFVPSPDERARFLS